MLTAVNCRKLRYEEMSAMDSSSFWVGAGFRTGGEFGVAIDNQEGILISVGDLIKNAQNTRYLLYNQDVYQGGIGLGGTLSDLCITFGQNIQSPEDINYTDSGFELSVTIETDLDEVTLAKLGIKDGYDVMSFLVHFAQDAVAALRQYKQSGNTQSLLTMLRSEEIGLLVSLITGNDFVDFFAPPSGLPRLFTYSVYGSALRFGVEYYQTTVSSLIGEGVVNLSLGGLSLTPIIARA